MFDLFFLSLWLIIDEIKNQFSWWEDNKEQRKRMKKSDTSFPILTTIEKDGTKSVADGLNRLKKAISIEKRDTIPAYVVPMKDIQHLKVKLKNDKNLKEDLRDWFSKSDPDGDWKRINSKGEVAGPCAREEGEPKPKCMSKKKRASLTKKERAAAVRAKRRHDPDADRSGSPINVSNYGKGKISEEILQEKNIPTSPEKWSQAKALARSKFKVYPSAYANGWAAKKYKAMGGGWETE